MATTKRICSVPDCNKPHSSRGFCKTHAARFRKYGDPNILLKQRGRLCSVPGCDRKHDSNGYCGAHAMRWRRHGNPLLGGTSHHEPMKFLERVAVNYTAQDCLIWPYGKGAGNRPIVHVGDTTRSASRIVCELTKGQAPTPVHEAAHSCGNGHLGCVNPMHLSWKTPKENEADKIIHGTHQFGENNPSAKLTRRDVLAIRSMRGKFTQREIASAFGVTQSLISMIQTGKIWPDEL